MLHAYKLARRSVSPRLTWRKPPQSCEIHRVASLGEIRLRERNECECASRLAEMAAQGIDQAVDVMPRVVQMARDTDIVLVMPGHDGYLNAVLVP